MSSAGETFGTKLRRKREAMGLSQAAFAEKMGVHRRSQINYEAGKRQPTLDYLEALKHAGIDVSQLMGANEAAQMFRAAAYFHLLSTITALIGVGGDRFAYALDQAIRITLDNVKMQGDEIVTDKKKLDVEMTKLAVQLLHDAGVEGF